MSLLAEQFPSDKDGWLHALEHGAFTHAFDAAREIPAASLDDHSTARFLRLLIEGGYYSLAEATANRISTDSKDEDVALTARLFESFAAFFTHGSFEAGAVTIEGVLESERAGSNAVLRARALDLLSRLVSLGVSFRLLPDDALFRSRHLMSEAIQLYRNAGRKEEFVRSLLAMAQMHCIGTYPDFTTALCVLDAALVNPETCDLPQVRFDVERRRAELQLFVKREPIDPRIGRSRFATLAEVASTDTALAESLGDVAFARVLRNKGMAAQEELERAGRTFERLGYLSGLYETTSTLAAIAVEAGHYARAIRKFRELVELSDRMGFSQGIAVAQLGIFQVHAALGEGEQARAIANSLLKLSTSPAISGSLGLSMSAAFQLLGDYEKALSVAQKAESLFKRKRLPDMLSQALFVEGSCFAGLNRWDRALNCWKKGAAIDRDLGNLAAETEKLVACAQAHVMEDFVETGKVSDVSLARAMKALGAARLRVAGDTVELARLRAKIHQTEAQLLVVAKDLMRALRSYSASRDEFMSAQSLRDVAFVDAQSGLTLLELGRSKYPHMLEEAVDSFRRALDYCNSEHVLSLRWKIHYYLSFACLLVAQAKGDGHDSERWREAGREWLKVARSDVHALQEQGLRTSPVDADFSPHLSFEAVDKLDKELNPGAEKRKQSRDVVVDFKSKRSSRQLH